MAKSKPKPSSNKGHPFPNKGPNGGVLCAQCFHQGEKPNQVKAEIRANKYHAARTNGFDGVTAMTERISEKELQDAIIGLATMRGWLVHWNAAFRATKAPPGELDLRLIRPPRVIFSENKNQKGRLTEAQQFTVAALTLCPGVEVYVWKPSDWRSGEIERILE